MDDDDWNRILRRIQRGKCTPFLGAGASAGVLPLGGAIAEQWADERSYPLWDRENLPRVAQFVAVVEEDPMAPKEDIQKFFDGKAPDLSHEDEPHRVLAGLPLPIFLTTNYDDFMTQALRARGKQPEQEFCRWTARPTSSTAPP